MMYRKAPGRHKLKIYLLVCLLPLLVSTDTPISRGEQGSHTQAQVESSQTAAADQKQQQTTSSQADTHTGASELDESDINESDDVDEGNDVATGQGSPKKKGKVASHSSGSCDSDVENTIDRRRDPDTQSEVEPASQTHHDSIDGKSAAVARETEGEPAGEEPQQSTPDTREGVPPELHHSDHTQRESEKKQHEDVRVGESERGNDNMGARAQARDEYRRELEEERKRLELAQKMVGHEQQLGEEEEGSSNEGERVKTSSKTLLERERKRLTDEQKMFQLMQQQQQQQQQKQHEQSHDKEGEGGRHPPPVDIARGGGEGSLYDSGYGGQDSDPRTGSSDSSEGVPSVDVSMSDTGEPGDTGESGASGEPGAGGGEGYVDGKSAGDSSEMSDGGGGGEGGEKGTCNTGDCPEDVYQRGMKLAGRKDPKIKAQGYSLLKQAAEAGHTKAVEQVAYAHLVGSALERNFTWAFEKFSAMAEVGDPIGQQGLGFMYSTGIGVNSSQAKALLYYTFAALGGHHFSQMAMGYRSMMGISVVQCCDTALYYYRKAAKKVVDEVTIVTGGLLMSKVRLMEEDNEATNVYGVSEDDMIHYHNVFTDSGNTGAQVLLGVYYMFGMAGAERSFKMALRFLEGAAKEGFAAANALIGKIYAEGSDEIEKDYEMAMKYFQKAKNMGHADGYSGLGMLYFFGMGVDKDYARALELFQKAAEKASAEAQYYLGHMFYEGIGVKRNVNKALGYFQLASHGGHVLAIYSLAEMHADGRAMKRNCNYAVELFKAVAERGQWTRMMEEAERSYDAGDLDSALMVYLLMAELGLEVAQTNAAYILEQAEGLTVVKEKESLKRALVLWNRSASQGYSMARVKLGDYYYYGQGTEVNYEAAASQYRIASDKQSSAQAMFNLGYMYQQGYGLEKDYHLAKRYYDMAAETSSEACVPVFLALLNLNLLHYYGFFLQVMSSPAVTETVAKVEAVAGENWDMYLITLLSGLLALVFMWRWRH